MRQINLQNKTSAEKGEIRLYWFENQSIGLKRTLFHQIDIPLTPFDSGIDYESQPVSTVITIRWLNLDLKQPTDLDGLTITTTPNDDAEITIYLGNAHNPCDIRQLELRQVKNNLYEINCVLFVEFEYEGVAENEIFSFTTQLELHTEIKY